MVTCIKCNLNPAKKGRLTCKQCTPKEHEPLTDPRTLRSEYNFNLVCAINPEKRLTEKIVRKCQYFVGHEMCQSENVKTVAINTYSGKTITKYICPKHTDQFMAEANIQLEIDKENDKAEKLRLEENRKHWDEFFQRMKMSKRV